MLVSALDGHRLWAPIYDCFENPLLALESRAVRDLLRGINPRRVVDVACGTGRWMRYFAGIGAAVIGIDLCSEMLQQAGQHPEICSRLVLGDAQSLPLNNDVADLVICSFAASYVCNLSRLVSEIARITAPAGWVVLTDMHISAIDAGWRRSFKRGSSLYELEHFRYSPEQICAASDAAGLRFDTARQAFFGEDERNIFDRAGKDHLYSDVKTIPAVWIGAWTKPC